MVDNQFDAALGCGRSYVFGIVDKLSGQKNTDTEIEIVVSNGLHAGCRTHIEGPEFTIGSEETADIMLLDPEIGGPSVMLRIVKTMLGPTATLTTDRTDVRLNGMGIARGTPYAKLPCTVTIGSIRLDIRPADSDSLPLKRRGELMPIAGLATIGAVAMIASFWAPTPNAAVIAMPKTQTAHHLRTPPNSLSDMVQDHISEAKMSQYMTADIGPDDTVVISGTIPKGKMPTWHSLRGVIDAHPESGRVITRVKEARVLENIPAIKMVRLNPVPSIFLANGASLTIGDELVRDWNIVSISETDIKLARDGEQVNISY